MKNSLFRNRILSILILGALIGLSLWFGLSYASSEDFHHKDITYLQEKQNNAKALSASASAVSVLISLLPDDTATPLANQIADIGRDFLIVLSALAAEQFLLTITGRIAFCWIIPIALGILILFVLLRRKLFLQIGVKLAIAGCVLYMLVPVTLRITRLVDGPYEEVVENSLQQSREIEEAFHYNENGVVMPGVSGSDAIPETEAVGMSEAPTEVRPEFQTEILTEIQTEIQTEEHPQVQEKKQEKKLPWYERLWNAITGTASDAVDTVSKVPEKVSDTAADAARKVSDTARKVSDTASDVAHKVSDTASAAIDKVIETGEKASDLAAMAPELPQMASDLLNNLVDAFVLMIVTTCVLPLFILIGLLWIMSQILNINPDWEKQTP